MTDELDFRLIAAVQAGLPIVARPYAAIAEQVGTTEQEVIDRLAQLKRLGLIKRWGVVVKHRQLGYRANAMIVMDVPDSRVAEIGGQISRYDFINLCYQRPRQGETWPYNLYCMIHGKSRDTVLRQWAELREACGLSDLACEVLFSRRCFKQRGALYARRSAMGEGLTAFPNTTEGIAQERQTAATLAAPCVSADAEEYLNAYG